MFDQSILARLLAWYAAAPALPRRLSIVTANSHPAVPRFTGLGNLNAPQLMELFARRNTLAADALALGREVWSAWTAADPRELAALGLREMPALPWMPAAIRRHLEELPWTTDGLGLTERLILAAIGEGATGRAVFRRVMDAEPAPWMGDSMCYHAIRELAAGETPLLAADGATTAALDEIAGGLSYSNIFERSRSSSPPTVTENDWLGLPSTSRGPLPQPRRPRRPTQTQMGNRDGISGARSHEFHM
jgi:hypothetical protein